MAIYILDRYHIKGFDTTIYLYAYSEEWYVPEFSYRLITSDIQVIATNLQSMIKTDNLNIHKFRKFVRKSYTLNKL